MVSEGTKDRFRRFASPACLLFGALCGIVYSTMVYFPVSHYEARIIIAALFISGGAMGLAYFETRLIGVREVAFLVEQLRIFFSLWFLLGLLYGLLVLFRLQTPDGAEPGDAAISFLIGAVVGTVWMMALILFVGIRTNIASWNVIRFPAWIGAFARWLWYSAAKLGKRR